MEFGTHQTAPGIELRYATSIVAGGIPLVLLNGRGEFIEKYHEVIGELNDRGYSVWTLDWRGQGLSTRVLSDRLRGHIDSFDDYLQDLKHWLDAVVFPAVDSPPMLMAHSLGGHIALRLLSTHSERFARAVVIAPLVSFRPRGLLPVLSMFIRWMCWFGFGHWYFWGGKYDPANPTFEDNTLTNCPNRFEIKPALIRKNPALAIAGVTFQWLNSAILSNQQLFGEAAMISSPVLLVSPEDEQVVDRDASLEFASRLPNGEVFSIPEAKHEVLFERDRILQQFWARTIPFYMEHLR